ncbi:MAG: UDP-N-acetylmuramoyl-L-alanyl-D-glutamate--2,6-diaminopimelate ligase [Rhodocyclaceae bacterium]|nr:UDP-N-acetylmuramoyl-L-alanyl-D-glutamate--2,6-diaminopimelate ligase [Rhodocyclaceae bacterium]MDZ4215446.1 UDP-N-acetylmuramoyl-L-alanyl-D-glutamate--2,6-diaminopimelate ligase [Rhodocyclaceae bacterium]
MSIATRLLDDLKASGIQPTRLAIDSRRVQPGDIFLAMPGAQVDGRQFIADAVARGAVAVIHEGSIADIAVSPTPTFAVEDLAAHAGEIAHLVYGRPSEQVWLCGVTGTNGKTSVSQWIAQAMNAIDCKCAVIGTLGNGFPPQLEDSPNTTPDAITLHASLARYLREGAVACAMEVSSIGLEQGRINGAHVDVAVFTNLTRDHLEYHGNMAAYAAAKARLFDLPGLSGAVINLDDPFGRELATRLTGKVSLLGYTLEAAPDLDRHGDMRLRAEDIDMTANGVRFRVRDVDFTAPVVGMFNVSNLLAVIGALLLGGETLEDCALALKAITPPPGRMQTLGGDQQPLVVVDYAHSPDALEKVLNTLRVTATARGGQLCCVFGCGGDRDAGKRPQMGAIAEQLADRVVVTSDNPRSENPLAIIAAIRAGMAKSVACEADRAKAIITTITQASAHDVILIAGKGHEPYQEIAGVRHPFSDLAVARSSLSEWHAC